MFKGGIAERSGVLGINRRNREYLLDENPRKYYPLVDDKLKTKELLEKHGISSPKLFFSISDNYEFRRLEQINELEEFVLKPAKGAMGRGILVVSGREGDRWKKVSGGTLSFDDIKYHVANTISGLYALGGRTDKAFFEYRIKSHSVLSEIAYQGVADIRVIVYKGKPVMSMLRLPTKESEGKANLHQGAVGVGVEMERGRTFGGVHHDKFIDRHPDKGVSLDGIEIPFWGEILVTAVKIAGIFPLGYFGIDFVIDEGLGPMVLELNARPGLSIQIANRTGLLGRIKERHEKQGTRSNDVPE